MNSRYTCTFLIVAGGTGGHVFPALAVAEMLREQGFEIIWLGTKRGIEAKIIPTKNIPILYISVGGLRGKRWTKWLFAPLQLLYALYQSIRIIRKTQPQGVLAMGGYVSGPVGLAAWLMRKPLLVHEQNAVAGTTNQILSIFARRVMTSFPNTFPERVHPILTGNPIRSDFSKIQPPAQRYASRSSELRILVLGGSQGAATLNQVIPAALEKLRSELLIEVWHQTGKAAYAETKTRYHQSHVNARVDHFIDDVANAYAWADVVICRAGALTVAELSAVGIGAILIPYPYAISDHQTKNSIPLVDAKAAILILEEDFTIEKLYNHLLTLGKKRDRLLSMAEAAIQCSHLRATVDVVNHCKEICNVQS